MARVYTEADLCLLLRRVAEGDHAAFEAIVKQFEASVLAVALSVTGQRQDAEDAAQEAFVKIWRSADTFRGDGQSSGTVRVWVLQIARRAALDVVRKRKRRPVLPLVSDEGEAYDPPDEDVNANPAAAYMRGETVRTVREAIADLPSELRQILILRDIEGMAYGDIARVMGCREGTVKSRIFRAREKLKKILESRNFSL